MAGIFGCYIRNNALQADAICRGLQHHALAGFLHKTEFKTFAGNSIGLGYAGRHSAPDLTIFSDIEGRYFLGICGEFFLPSGDQLNSQNFHSEFIPNFERKGKEMFLDCDGAFFLVIYDDVQKKLYLITDPFGNLALHYANTEKGFLFSSQQKALAEVLGINEIDREAISEFIALGQCLNGKTFYKKVRRVQPASFVIIDASGKIDVEKYYTPSYDTYSNTKENLKHIEESLLKSVDIRTRRSDLIVSLSGGLDSRMTFAALQKLGRTDKITLFTHGMPDSGDVKVATQISERYHVSHVRLFFDDEFFKNFPTYWRQAIQVSEGGFGIESAMNLPTWEIESERFSVAMDSHAGAVYRRQFHKAREGFLRSSNNFAKTFFNHFATLLFHSDMISKEFREKSMKIGVQGIDEYFASHTENLDVGDRIDRYYLEQMSANKYSLSGNAQLNYIGLSHPLLSLDAYNAVTHIPAAERKRNIVYRYLFDRFAPELKSFWADDSGYPVPYIGYRGLRYAAPIFERGLLMLPDYFRRFSLKKPVITREIIADKNFAALKDILLMKNSLADSILIPKNIGHALSEYERGKKHNAGILLQAANLKLLLEYVALLQ